MENKVQTFSLLTEDDIHLFREGSHFRLYEKMGSKLVSKDGVDGAYFCVWAPNAKSVCVTGDFNSWSRQSHPLILRSDGSGIWEGFIAGLKQGDAYKYFITSNFNNYSVEKADPYAFHFETPKKTASKLWKLDYSWSDSVWMNSRKQKNANNAPISIYEVHLGSWRRKPEDNDRYLTYTEIADSLADYCRDMGFTHVELLPVMEHPFDPSWGYQSLGYFAPTSRFGTPQDFMYLVDKLHREKIAVILDWVPSHFPFDEHGLAFFDGTCLYEHADKRQGFHPDWKSAIFNYGRNEVKDFLISSALFWLDKYHIDGLRVDGVASMLYLDYSRKEGEWLANKYGGKENLEAIEFIKRLNHVVYENYDGVQTYAEESTSWPMVSKPTYLGGLGFGYKWNMGWMNDVLSYMQVDPVFRKYHHGKLTFSFIYAFSENFVLPFSHDEVANGKGSLISKLPGDKWRQFANLRVLFAYMYSHPGKKLLFMGGEFGQFKEWDFNGSLDWHLLAYPENSGVKKFVRDLNSVYKQNPALFENDLSWEGFSWVDANDSDNSIITFIRKAPKAKEAVLCIFNFTPIPRHNYKIGVDYKGKWEEILNSDAKEYFGSGVGNLGFKETKDFGAHAKPYSLEVSIPPLAAVFFRYKY
ncbi:1,4-alpha-glucan branching protein GlgB [Endomicrobium proavitum]|uniref:1,4-alpha-glucan branching enzyme GlgB n=1 Tax=Endomicrobium proavitum TaxID=1408281 RepID=A0A0G3WHK4_9BACT|nr:1,4-alpha-glucan branching protein GlgB [Endomicrobium proavitum]AKL98116.1 1,4-alpha-glucan branching enzyme [Endomicrobium proavitum]